MKVAGAWAYLYRAVDSAGETFEFMLPPRRASVVNTPWLAESTAFGCNARGHRKRVNLSFPVVSGSQTDT